MTGQLSNLPAMKLGSFLGAGSDLSDLASQFVNMIEGGKAGLTPGRGAWGEPLAEEGIGKMISSPGMDPMEKQRRRQSITGGFQSQTRALAGAGGDRGFFSPEGVGQAAGGAPASALAGGLANLEAEDARVKREEREKGVGYLTSLLPGLMEHAGRPGEAFGSMMGELYKGQPVRLGTKRWTVGNYGSPASATGYYL